MRRQLLACRTWLGLLLGLLTLPASGVAAADDERGAPPRLLRFERYDAPSQTVHLLQTIEALVPSVFKEVTPDGRTIEKVAELVTTVETVQALDTKELRVFNLKGDVLKLTETFGKLKKGDPILAVSAGKLVPIPFRSLFKDDVIVLELPPAMAPMPAPVPVK